MCLNSPYALLMTKEIYSILDGDTKFGDYILEDNTKLQIEMPYLSGHRLCEISTRFGFPKIYSWNSGKQSRWEYLNDLFKFCIENDKCSNLLSFLFSKEQFSDILRGHSPEIIDSSYRYLVNFIIKKINELLYYGVHELRITGNTINVVKLGTVVEINAPRIKSIDRVYIKSITDRALQDIDLKNYDSAITKSRTLLEEVFCYVIEIKKEKPVTSGKIKELYNQVKGLYNMHFDSNMDMRVKILLSGLEKIITSISEMRNKNSDAHGVGESRLTISDYHARLFVNSSMTMSEFILSVANNAIT